MGVSPGPPQLSYKLEWWALALAAAVLKGPFAELLDLWQNPNGGCQGGQDKHVCRNRNYLLLMATSGFNTYPTKWVLQSGKFSAVEVCTRRAVDQSQTGTLQSGTSYWTRDQWRTHSWFANGMRGHSTCQRIQNMWMSLLCLVLLYPQCSSETINCLMYSSISLCYRLLGEIIPY